MINPGSDKRIQGELKYRTKKTGHKEQAGRRLLVAGKESSKCQT